jgi:transcriptional regulator GlxA family with amidase domain
MSSSIPVVHIGILVFPDCGGSSAVAPRDAFNIANLMVQFRPAEEHVRFEACWVSVDGRMVSNRDGLCFPTKAIASLPLDVLMVPGVEHTTTRDLVPVLEAMTGEQQALREFAASGRLIATNCSASFLLAEAGLLTGRRATTSWWLGRYFHKRYPDVALDTEALVVEDGAIISSGGMTSYIDLALHIIGQYGGDALRQMTAKVLVADSNRASQSPYVAAAVMEGNGHAIIERARRWLNQHMDQEWTMAELASYCNTSPRTLLRRFQKALGLSPIQYTQQLRVERAKGLLESTSLSLEDITGRCGYADVSTFSTVFKRWAQLTPREYRGRFGLRS